MGYDFVMEMHQLKYFMAIVETGSFSKAAKRCYVAQPSLSQQIIKLERELGRKLFDRLGKKVILTDAGATLLPRAERIVRDANEVKAQLLDATPEAEGSLSIGIITTVAPYLLPLCLEKFTKSNPDGEISVYENLTENLIDLLVNFEIDMAIMSLPVDNNLIETHTLFHEPLVLSIPNGFDIADEEVIGIADLEGIPFIALDVAHCLGEQVHDFCFQNKLKPCVVCNTWNVSTALNCVSGGLGISIVPLMAAVSNKSAKYRYRRLKENPTRPIVSAYYKDRSKKKLGGRFEETVKSEFRKNAEKLVDIF